MLGIEKILKSGVKLENKVRKGRRVEIDLQKRAGIGNRIGFGVIKVKG